MYCIELFKSIIIHEIALCFNTHFISNSLPMHNNMFVLYFLLRKLRHANCNRQKKEENDDYHLNNAIKEMEHTAPSPKATYNRDKDNTGYLELGEITQEPQYDQIL